MAKKKNQSYTSSDIEIIEFDRDRVQAQPHLYIPDKKIAGLIHLIREAKDNCDDEVMACIDEGIEVDNKVIVEFNEITKESRIVDAGRGIPHEKMKDLCEVLHSSGKFNKGDKGPYKFAGGQHRQYCAI